MFQLAISNSLQAPQVLVETGTYAGKTSLLAKQHFSVVHTIELSEKLYRNALPRLQAAGIVCHLGDTRVIVPLLCEQLTEPVAWYLDAHYYRDPLQLAADNPLPVFEELAAIARRPWPDVVIVDDVRDFGRTDHGLPGWDVVTQESICAALGRVLDTRIVGDQCLVWRGNGL